MGKGHYKKMKGERDESYEPFMSQNWSAVSNNIRSIVDGENFTLTYFFVTKLWSSKSIELDVCAVRPKLRIVFVQN